MSDAPNPEVQDPAPAAAAAPAAEPLPAVPQPPAAASAGPSIPVIAPLPAASPAPASASAPAVAPAPGATPSPKPAAPPAKPLELAPEGTDCPHCGQRMRVFAKYARSVEYCCPSLKEESPVLADKYAEWRDLYLKSRVTRPIPL